MNAPKSAPAMSHKVLFDDGTRRWTVFGRDPAKPSAIIDTNQYLVQHAGRALLLDPGGTEIFPSYLASLTEVMDIGTLDVLFASHQDPDIISSLPYWQALRPGIEVYASWLWTGFIAHFGGKPPTGVPDEGGTLPLGGSRDLRMIPAHYCHSSGNFSVYDPVARILFSGDLGAALLPGDAPLFVSDFSRHIQHMEGFHRRWMPSNAAKDAWIARVRTLPIDMICPQHGAIFRGADVGRFLDWLSGLEVGSARGSAAPAH